MLVGYIRSYDDNGDSLEMQRELIERYCYEHDVMIDSMLCDSHKVRTRLKADAQDLLKIGYVERYKGEAGFPEFDKLLLLIATGEVDSILVDDKIRFNVNIHMNQFFAKLCNIHDVNVIEVGSHPPDKLNSVNRAAIYLDTNKSECKPAYIVADLDELYVTARQFGWAVTSSLVDRCRNIGGRHKYQLLLDNLAKFDVIVTKAMFNIDIKTSRYIHYLSEFQKNDVMLYTLTSGEQKLWSDDSILNCELRVVSYDGFSRNQEEADLLVKIMEVFVKYKTNWSLINRYYEGYRVRIDEEQVELEEMVNKQDELDVILVKRFNRINVRTTKLEKLLLKLKKNKLIYSMEEGAYLYGKKEESSVL